MITLVSYIDNFKYVLLWFHTIQLSNNQSKERETVKSIGIHVYFIFFSIAISSNLPKKKKSISNFLLENWLILNKT